MRRISIPLVLTALTLGAAAKAQSPLTTIFASNNGGNVGGAVYFDLIVGNTGLSVTALDMNYSASVGTAVGVQVYARAGTHVGFEGSMAGWSLVAQDNGMAMSAGTDMPTNIQLTNPFCVPAGATVGIALVASGSAHRYTNGTGTNQVYSTNELTLMAGSATNVPFTGSPFTPRVWNGAIYYNLAAGCTLSFPASLQAVAEATLNSGTLSGATPQLFADNWFLRWSLVDASGTTAGNLGVVVANFAPGGSPPIGVTPLIPGFNQLWAGSMPPGVAIALPPAVVGGTFSFPVPAGILTPGDTLRIQGLTLDPAITPLPVLATPETIELVHSACQVVEGFEGIPTGVGNYPMGWANGGGTQEWRVHTGGTSSANTGPSGAFSGSNYMYCETSTTAAAHTYIMNTAVYPSAGLSSVNFALSRIGATIGTLEVRMGDGTGTFPTLLGTYTGPEPSGTEWTLESLPLGSPPANVQLQFQYTRGTSFTGDLAIDNFCLQ